LGVISKVDAQSRPPTQSTNDFPFPPLPVRTLPLKIRTNSESLPPPYPFSKTGYSLGELHGGRRLVMLFLVVSFTANDEI